MKSVIVSIPIAAIIMMAGCASTVQVTPKQIDGIRKAAARVLPEEANVEVTIESRFLAKPTLVISAHLLAGHSPDETSPYVRGDYATHEKLTRLIRYRCAKILRSVVNEALVPDVSEIKIQARHGVREYTEYRIKNETLHLGPVDVTKTIYVVSVSIRNVKAQNWLKISEDDIMALWIVERNIIPELVILPEGFRWKSLF